MSVPACSGSAGSRAHTCSRGRGSAATATRVAPAAAEGERADRAQTPAEDESEPGGRGDRLRLMNAKLRAPVGQAHHLAAQPLERCAQLLAVLLDRGPDLIRGPGWHQVPL